MGRWPTWTRSQEADRIHHEPGAPRAPHGLRPRRWAARAQDPGDLAGHRRRLRQQGADLPRLRGAVVGSIVTKRPVKWMKDRSSNLTTTGFARDYHMHGEIAATARETSSASGRRARRPRCLQRHGAHQVPRRLLPHLHRLVRLRGGALQGHGRLHQQGARRWPTPARSASPRPCTSSSASSTDWPPSSGWTPPSSASRTCCGPSSSRIRHRPAGSTTPATTAARCTGDAHRRLRRLRREQAEKRERGEYMGIGISFFTEGVGAGPRKHMDILGLGMADGCELRLHPHRQGPAATVRADPGSGPRDDVRPDRQPRAGDPARGHRGDPRRHRQHAVRPGDVRQRSTPVSGAAAAIVSQRCATRHASWPARRSSAPPTTSSGSTDVGRSGATRTRARRSEIALLAHSNLELPEGVEGHLDAAAVYNPPNLTYPFGAYICVVDVDPGTGEVKVRRFIAVDDCGPRINPMIVEGQVHGGLVDGIGMALMQAIAFDEDGNCLGGSFMDYLLPTTMEVPRSSWARPSRRRRTTRSASRASASRRPSDRRRRSSTP